MFCAMRDWSLDSAAPRWKRFFGCNDAGYSEFGSAQKRHVALCEC